MMLGKKGNATMRIENHEKVTASMVCFEELEKWTRLQAQGFIQWVLEEEVTEFSRVWECLSVDRREEG